MLAKCFQEIVREPLTSNVKDSVDRENKFIYVFSTSGFEKNFEYLKDKMIMPADVYLDLTKENWNRLNYENNKKVSGNNKKYKKVNEEMAEDKKILGTGNSVFNIFQKIIEMTIIMMK